MYISRNENNSYYKTLLERNVKHPELLQYYKTEYRDINDAHYEYEQYLEKNKVSKWETIKNFFSVETESQEAILRSILTNLKP